MRGWLLALVVLIAIAPGASAAQQICHMNNYGQSIDYPCGSADAPASTKEGTPWYADQALQAVLAIVGLLGSAGAGYFTYRRVQTRKRALITHIAALEQAYAAAKVDPAPGVAALTARRAAIRLDHDKGRLDDGQYLDLDKRARDYLVRLRLLEIDMRFRSLPPAFLAQLRHLVDDGNVSQAEADLIEHHASAYQIGEPARSDLIRLAREWARADALPTAEFATDTPPVSVHVQAAPVSRPKLQIFKR